MAECQKTNGGRALAHSHEYICPLSGQALVICHILKLYIPKLFGWRRGRSESRGLLCTTYATFSYNRSPGDLYCVLSLAFLPEKSKRQAH